MRFIPALLACAMPAFGQTASERALAVIGGQTFDGGAGVATFAALPTAPAAAKPVARPVKSFEDVVVALIDELALKDPVLFARIRAEDARIRALPTTAARAAAVEAAYPRLEAALDRSVAEGKLSAAGAANWDAFRAEAKSALAAGTLFEMAQFAGKAFDEKVRRLLDTTRTTLDAAKKFPETKDDYLRLSEKIHAKLAVPGNSTALTTKQLDEAFGLAGAAYGIRPEFLKYMAKTESGLRQIVPSNPAAVGIMQIEHVHQSAYAGPRNVANDTITNIVYGALLRAQTDREIARRFTAAGLTPPGNPRVVEFLGDLAYNRGPGLLRHIAQHAAQQRIDVDKFSEYVGGRGGSYDIIDGGRSIVVRPGPGTGIDKTGANSVLALSSEAVGRVQFSKKLTAGLGDRNGDGRVDHLDVWLTRGIKYLEDPKL